MKKNNIKRKNPRPECGANAPLPLSKYQQYVRSLLSLWEAVTPRIFERRVQQWYTSKKMPSQCPQNGRSMIEMLGVLAIIGVLSIGGIMGYSKAMMRYKINKTIEQITYIAGNIRTTFANQGNYQGLDWDVLWKKAHLFPDDMWKEGEDYPQHAWGGQVQIDDESQKGESFLTYKAFYVAYEYQIPEEACIELLSYDWSVVGVTNVRTWYHAGDDTCLKFPTDIENAVSICTAFGGVEGIYFYFNTEPQSEYWQDMCTWLN